jgi:hypothetical protein
MIPYAFDLVRLAASVRLAPKRDISNRSAADAIIDSYRAGLAKPRPTLLDEQETWMRPYVACTDDDRRKLWKEVRDYPDAKPPPQVAEGYGSRFPNGLLSCALLHALRAGEVLGGPATSQSRNGAAAGSCARRRFWCHPPGTGHTAYCTHSRVFLIWRPAHSGPPIRFDRKGRVCASPDRG